MPDIVSISGVAAANIVKRSGRSKANIVGLSSRGASRISFPASGPSIKTDNLHIWWDAADGYTGTHPSGTGIRIANKAKSNNYAADIEGDHRLLNGSTSNWTTVDSVDAILLDGSNDNILTRQIYFGADYFSEGLGASNVWYEKWDDMANNDGGFTVQGWFRSFNSTTWSTSTNFFSAYMNDGFRLRTNNSNGSVHFASIQDLSYRQGAYTPSPSVIVGPGAWHMVTFIYDKSNTQWHLYVDDTLEHTRTNTGIGFDSWVAGSMVIGAYRTSGTEAKKFYVGGYKMYNTVLTSQEVADNYDAEKSNYGIT